MFSRTSASCSSLWTAGLCRTASAAAPALAAPFFADAIPLPRVIRLLGGAAYPHGGASPRPIWPLLSHAAGVLASVVPARAAILACLLLVLALPATAGAATVSATSGTLTYRGGSAANDLTIGLDGGLYRVHDDRGVTAQAGCAQAGPRDATCPEAGIGRIAVSGEGGDDALRVLTPSAPSVNGGAGDDTLAVGDGGARLSGSSGDDTIAGGPGSESVNGGDGIDRIAGGGGPDRLNGDQGTDQIDGGPGDDVLRGGDGDDTLVGGGETDRVEGGDDEDVLDGGLGPDVLDGGRGTDTADYGDRSETVIVDLDGNPDDGQVDEGDNVTNDVERIVGGAGPDRLTAITGRRTLIGNAGDDVLHGGRGADALQGGAGDDVLNGDISDDELDGGEGTDTADYTGRFDEVVLDLTKATATLQRGNRTGPRAKTERDRLRSIENGRGTSRNDTLIGDAGPNVLQGGSGADLLSGGAGPDVATYRARRSGVRVSLDDVADDGSPGEGDDVRSTVEDVLGGTGRDILLGNARRNGLNGGPGNDTIQGREGADRLTGGAGRDRVDAGPGRDLLALRDGAVDTGICGDGPDVAVADRGDRLQGCEKRR